MEFLIDVSELLRFFIPWANISDSFSSNDFLFDELL